MRRVGPTEHFFFLDAEIDWGKTHDNMDAWECNECQPGCNNYGEKPTECLLNKENIIPIWRKINDE